MLGKKRFFIDSIYLFLQCTIKIKYSFRRIYVLFIYLLFTYEKNRKRQNDVFSNITIYLLLIIWLRPPKDEIVMTLNHWFLPFSKERYWYCEHFPKFLAFGVIRYYIIMTPRSSGTRKTIICLPACMFVATRSWKIQVKL